MKTTLTLLSSILLSIWHSSALATPDNSCHGNMISKTFSSGALWEMCWTIDSKNGLALSQVHFQSPGGTYRRVLGAASLSQIQAVFDDGAIDPVYVNTDMGLGDDNAQILTRGDCPGGELHAENGRNVLCARMRDKGYLYKYSQQRQTKAFELSSYSQVGPRNYQIRWTFHENGTLEPAVGLSGILPAIGQSDSVHGWPVTENGETGTGFTDHYMWRLDFDLGADPANDSIQEINSIPTEDRLQKNKTIDTLRLETARRLNPDYKTFWRVLDNPVFQPQAMPISYEIVPGHYDQSQANSLQQEWLDHDLFFTVYQGCEQHAINNIVAGCRRNVSDYLSDEQIIDKSDIVAWYKLSHHYLPRSEDSNRISTRWSSFQLLPRDWYTQNPY